MLGKERFAEGGRIVGTMIRILTVDSAQDLKTGNTEYLSQYTLDTDVVYRSLTKITYNSVQGVSKM